MARRRLNKKVALIGSTVFLLLAMVAVVVMMRRTATAADRRWGCGVGGPGL
jgi:hypothetical protein